MTPRQLRVVGSIGLLAALCFLVGFVVDPTPPVAGSSAQQAIAHVAAYATQDRLAAFVFALSAAGLVAFVAGLRAWFADISSAPAWWRTVLLCGGIVTATMLIVASTLFFTVASHPLANPELVTLITDWANYAFIFAGFGVLVMVGSLTAIMLATGGPLTLLGRLGIAVTLLQAPYLATAFFSSGPFVAGGWISIIGFGAVAMMVTLTAVAVLWFARLMAAASRPS